MIFRVRCPSSRHTLGFAEVPDEFLVAGRPAVRFSARCLSCREDVNAVFVVAESLAPESPDERLARRSLAAMKAVAVGADGPAAG